MGRLSVAVAAVALSGWASAANAAPIFYNFTLSQTLGNVPLGGSGSFSIDDATFARSGSETFAYAGSSDVLLNLLFTIDGNTFGKPGSVGSSVSFQNGQLSGINYVGTSGSAASLVVGGLSYVYAGSAHASIGTISASASPAVPEPATWGMLLLGLGGVGYALRRREKVGVRVRFA